MDVGLLNQWVTLSRCPVTTPDSDGFFEDLSPVGVWAAIQPLSPSPNDRTISYLVTMRYHAGITVDTRIVHGSKELFVKGVQHVDVGKAELRLYCEEVQG